MPAVRADGAVELHGEITQAEEDPAAAAANGGTVWAQQPGPNKPLSGEVTLWANP